jgi:hypothetical protein
MLLDDFQQDARIKEFLEKADTSEVGLFNFFDQFVLYQNGEAEFLQKVARNVIKISRPYYLRLSNLRRFHFLKALAKLFEASVLLKHWEYQLSREDASWFWDRIPLFFSAMSGMIQPLEVMRNELGQVSRHHLHEKVLLVEGDTEANFVRTLQFLTRILSFDFPVYAYGGKGEIRNLVHLIREKNRQGVRVYLSYDKDRQSKSFVRKLQNACKVEKFFGFRRDFEAAFPSAILALACNEYSENLGKSNPKVTPREIEQLLKSRRPFVAAFHDRTTIQLNKVRFGHILGRVMAGTIDQRWDKIFNQRPTRREYRTEVYRFIRFLVRW